MSEQFTLKKAKIVERRVAKTLNEGNYGLKYKVVKYEYSYYDIVGVGEHSHYDIVEVKERRANDWDTWFIEKAKVDNMLKARGSAEKKSNTMGLHLACVCDGIMQLYNIDDIILYPVINRMMNKTTAKGFRRSGEKVMKEVYDFPKRMHMVHKKLSDLT